MAYATWHRTSEWPLHVVRSLNAYLEHHGLFVSDRVDENQPSIQGDARATLIRKRGLALGEAVGLRVPLEPADCPNGRFPQQMVELVEAAERGLRELNRLPIAQGSAEPR